jgi:hypothetical protein
VKRQADLGSQLRHEQAVRVGNRAALLALRDRRIHKLESTVAYLSSTLRAHMERDDRRTGQAALTRTGDGVGSATAQLLLRGGRSPVRLTPAAAQRLACDASLRLVFTDGHQILGSADPYATVSPALRAALIARDGGYRFPGCHHPPQLCENHHLVPDPKAAPPSWTTSRWNAPPTTTPSTMANGRPPCTPTAP